MRGKTLILVIGFHRSGTSAVAGCLARMGVGLGENLIPPALDNPKGFFESRAVVTFHDRLLASCGASWDNPKPAEFKIFYGARNAITRIVHDLPGPICAVKDPRASLFVPLWVDACKAEGVRLCILEVQRDPEATAASLAKREGWTFERARELVIYYTDTIANARLNAGLDSHSWQVIEFPSEVFGDGAWQRIRGAFGIEVKPQPSALAKFLDANLIHHGIPDVSVIIPSRNAENVLACVKSLRTIQPDMTADQIVIIADDLPLKTWQSLPGATWVLGRQPFIFAEAINAGARAAGDSDLLIAGDDVRFVAPGMVDRLRAQSAGVAAIAPEVAGACSQSAQRVGSKLTSPSWLTFICIYIPRKAWEVVGGLDERFDGYGCDDMDWCKRAKAYGPLLVDHGARVIHTDESSYRSDPNWTILYLHNMALYNEKWSMGWRI